MNAEEYLKKRYENDVKAIDDETESFDWRCCIYFRHVGRLEALVMTDRISMKRYDELMDDWKAHCPFNKRRTK
ncbi:MAG: hypothetical protein II008_06190 [Oscillospiraceae bacterium]|nr:hypothetical protein [Oscillospiraceae bacterium]